MVRLCKGFLLLFIVSGGVCLLSPEMVRAYDPYSALLESLDKRSVLEREVPKKLSTSLAVPYYSQEFSLSCEEASLRMALAYRGIETTDYEIVERVGYAPRARDTATNTWDDPYQMFVGYIDGVFGETGWGVYSPPIARVAESYGRRVSQTYIASPSWVADQVHAGSPVIIWGISFKGSAKYDAWKTPTGKEVVAPLYGHVRLVTGAKGDTTSPREFTVYDPLNGAETWSVDKMAQNLSAFGIATSQAVAVH